MTYLIAMLSVELGIAPQHLEEAGSHYIEAILDYLKDKQILIEKERRKNARRNR